MREPGILYPWRRGHEQGRVRRAWVIPPISVSENHKRLPYPLVQVRGCEATGRPWVERGLGCPQWVPGSVCFKVAWWGHG